MVPLDSLVVVSQSQLNGYNNMKSIGYLIFDIYFGKTMLLVVSIYSEL